jgi:hypothetical protein
VSATDVLGPASLAALTASGLAAALRWVLLLGAADVLHREVVAPGVGCCDFPGAGVELGLGSGVGVGLAEGDALPVGVPLPDGAGLPVGVPLPDGAGLPVDVALPDGAGLPVDVALPEGVGLPVGVALADWLGDDGELDGAAEPDDFLPDGLVVLQLGLLVAPPVVLPDVDSLLACEPSAPPGLPGCPRPCCPDPDAFPAVVSDFGTSIAT